MNCFSNDTLSLERKPKMGVAGNNPDEWKNSYYSTKEGQLYVDSSYIFGCLREASFYTKSGRGSIQAKFSATMQVLDDKILFNRYMPTDESEFLLRSSDDDVYLDVRSVRNPNTKGRNVRYRVAMSEGWETDFILQWDDTIVSSAQVHQVLIDAGSLIGLADGRNIGFGRFEVVLYEDMGNVHAKKSAS
ncbi:MAG: hypothetical protein H9W81_16405 [Enterococcus sp.]|nr:hypothetical protein [Enterococcus sp.]